MVSVLADCAFEFLDWYFERYSEMDGKTMSEKCPYCGSEKTETRIAEDEYGETHSVNVCLDCHFDWEDYP